ncbi:hypothetical protein [Deinococcus roseus]|uniref:DUF4926 domain-containing protein n=1 Tax=Deinococcus roseus TaxID=392414 RepID=A0ABQ2CWW8_9DEIO|nr:hypothetical protein [Deinococcus roseus]GGJ27698.1 hypothetical protein GCM10008938_12230 [Deinococcus roseus]
MLSDLFIPAGTLVMCPDYIQGTVQRTDGGYVQVVTEDRRQEFWLPMQLLLKLNASRLFPDAPAPELRRSIT